MGHRPYQPQASEGNESPGHAFADRDHDSCIFHAPLPIRTWGESIKGYF
jgi:hypothetical protein